MCYFPLVNNNVQSLAWKKGVREFSCGACPECLKRRASSWALRAVYESREHAENCMVTLTYDNFERDSLGRKTGRELPPDRSLHVCKRDLQLFIKRLRKYFSDREIKYIATAEYGKTTHRAHYHCILFNVSFPDSVFYKMSKRKSRIYSSAILSRLWNHGICTIDSVNVTPAVARYCTKYCAKTRCEDTFMLFSHGIGEKGLMRDFNGKSYFLDGREYPIPRFVWQKQIMLRYIKQYPRMSYKYVNVPNDKIGYSHEKYRAYFGSLKRRKQYFAVRDNDKQYRQYLQYWQSKSKQFERLLPDVFTRISLLADEKYHNYKNASLRALFLRKNGIPVVAPNSNCRSAFYRYLEHVLNRVPDEFQEVSFYDSASWTKMPFYKRGQFGFSGICRPSRPFTANDTFAKLPYNTMQLGIGWRRKNLQKIS